MPAAVTTASILGFVMQALFTLKGASSSLQVFDEMASEETLGDLTLPDVEFYLDLGAKRGLFLRSCAQGEFLFAYTRNAILNNFANVQFADQTILNASGPFGIVTSSGPVQAPSYKGTLQGSGYACCPCTLAANPTTCSQ